MMNIQRGKDSGFVLTSRFGDNNNVQIRKCGIPPQGGDQLKSVDLGKGEVD